MVLETQILFTVRRAGSLITQAPCLPLTALAVALAEAGMGLGLGMKNRLWLQQQLCTDKIA
jgi:hypothetical protein